MIKQITVAECDICGFVQQAKERNGQYNETDYTIPDGWVHGKGNPNICICPDCNKTLRAKSIRYNNKENNHGI